MTRIGKLQAYNKLFNECRCWRIHVVADIFLRFKLRVEVSDNEVRHCI